MGAMPANHGGRCIHSKGLRADAPLSLVILGPFRRVRHRAGAIRAASIGDLKTHPRIHFEFGQIDNRAKDAHEFGMWVGNRSTITRGVGGG